MDGKDEAKNDDDVRVLILTGAGRGFCVGADVSQMVTGGGLAATAKAKRLDRLGSDWKFGGGDSLLYLNKPSIAAVNGPAAGYGFDLALLCDMRIASEKARFRGWIKVGILTHEDAMILPRLVGNDTITDASGEYRETLIPADSFSSPYSCLYASGMMLSTFQTMAADVPGKLYVSGGDVDVYSDTDNSGSTFTFGDGMIDGPGSYLSSVPMVTTSYTYIIGFSPIDPCREPDLGPDGLPGTLDDVDILINITRLEFYNTTATSENVILAGTTAQCTIYGPIDTGPPGPGNLLADWSSGVQTGTPMDLVAGTGTWVGTFGLLTIVGPTGTSDMQSRRVWELTLVEAP